MGRISGGAERDMVLAADSAQPVSGRDILLRVFMVVRKKIPEPVLAALCAAALFSIVYWIRGLYPFEDGSVVITDLYTQYLPLLYRFYDVVTGAKNLFLDFGVSGGANLYADTINEVLNPFNYVLLLFDRDMLYRAVNLVLLLYVAASAASADVFLLRTFPAKREWNLVLSLCYACSGYMAYNYQIIKWMYFPVLFPLFCLGLCRLFREKKGVIYAALLGYQLALSIQLGFMTLLFTFFGSGFYLFFRVKKEDRAKEIYRLGIYTLAGLLLSGAVLVPNIRILLASSRVGENLSYWDIMKRHGLDDLFERLFQIAHPVLLALFGYGMCGFMKEKAGGARKGTALKAAVAAMSGEGKFLLFFSSFLWLTVLFQPANLIWHMGSYVCFPVRYGYMVLFTGVCLVKWLLSQRGDGKRERYGFAGVLPCAAFCGGACSLTVLWEDRIVQAFSSLAISLICPKETAMVCLIWLLLFGAALCALAAGRRGKDGSRLSGIQRGSALFSAAICGVCLFLFIFLPPDYGVRRSDEEAYRIMAKQAEQDQKSAAGGAFERVKNGTDLPLNAALVNGRDSLAGYFPTGNRKYYETMERLGYQVQWVATQAEGGTGISDALLSAGMLFDCDASALVLRGNSVLERQQELAAFAGGADCMERFGQEDLKKDADGALYFQNPAGRTLYLDPAMTADSFRMRIDGEMPTDIPGAFAFAPHRIVEAGTFSEEEIHLLITDPGGAVLSAEGMEAALLDQESWVEKMVSGTQRARCLTEEELSVDKADGSIRISLAGAKNGQTVFLPVAALDGWRCDRNGEAEDITPVLDGFLGISVREGRNEIVLRFLPPGLWAGIILTALGAAGAALCCLGRRNGRGASDRTFVLMLADRLYRIGFVAALAGMYLIPAVGLMWYLAGKLFG